MQPKQWVIVALVGLAGVGLWKWHGHGGGGASDSAQAMVESGAGDDGAITPSPTQRLTPVEDTDETACTHLLDDSNRGEALAWLGDTATPRAVSRWDKQEAITAINDFYRAGALRVVTVDTQQIASTEVASQFVVVLPAEKEARQHVFDHYDDFQASFDEDAVPDKGQKYLLLTMD